jgi:tetratricopeptide (TPR) repeat protein
MHAVGVVAAALVAGAVFFGGGSGSGSVATLGAGAAVAACGLVALNALGRASLPRLEGAGVVAATALAGLLAWTGASVAWSIAGDRSWDALAKGLVYVAFALVGLAVAPAGGGRAFRLLAAVVAALLGAALLWALAGVAVPALFPEGDRIARLREPVGYWNALALLADAALALGLWLAAAVAGRGGRVAGALLLYAAVLVILLTQSRAGVIAGALVVALWLGLTRGTRLEGALVAVLAAAPALLVAGWAFTRPALVEDGAARADRVSDGAVFALLGVGGALVVVALALRVPLARLVRERRRDVLRGLAVTAAAAVVAAGGLLVARVGDPVAWVGDQFSRGECVNDPSRLTDLCANNRLAWWGEAVDIWQADRLAGAGAHTFEIARKRYRHDASDVSEPHSVPLQLLADTGIVGLALGLVLAAAVAFGIARALGRLRGEERTAAVALVALPAAWAAHALVDYDLDFLAVTGPAALVAAALLGAARPALRVPGTWLAMGASALAALAVVAVLVTPRLAEREVDRSAELYDEGRFDQAAYAADRARTLDPLALEPVLAAASAEELRPNLLLAAALYQEAVDLQPENPRSWFELGLFELLVRKDACAAYFALNEAYTLDPKGRQWVPGGSLDVARDAVNNGACEP